MSLKNFHTKGKIEAGCDEAGRGCLAGPVVASAVILPSNFRNKWLNDSKKLTDRIRRELEPEIKLKAIAWEIGIVSSEEIDKINILNASFLAMHRAITKLHVVPEVLLIDGNRFNSFEKIPHHCIIKGDGIYKSIAAASVLAKVHRDKLMEELHEKFPAYQWNKNMGYPTKAHREAIEKFGSCEHHRMSFTLLPDVQLELPF